MDVRPLSSHIHPCAFSGSTKKRDAVTRQTETRQAKNQSPVFIRSPFEDECGEWLVKISVLVKQNVQEGLMTDVTVPLWGHAEMKDGVTWRGKIRAHRKSKKQLFSGFQRIPIWDLA
jgi:hypothetical protein